MILKILASIAGSAVILFLGGIWKTKHIVLKMNKSKLKEFIEMCYESFLEKKGSWIGYQAEFANEPFFPHKIVGIFISAGAKIGYNCVIFHQVTIGSNTLCDSKGKGFPIIGDNCYIGAGAKIIGGITIGNNCRIGANAVVYQDMPDNSIAVSQPTRIIVKERIVNRYYAKKANGWFYFENEKWINDKEYQI